jgi:hypothetical protein
MSISTTLKAETQRHTEEVARIRGRLQAQLNALPDNPRITRLASSCFTMSSSNLGSSWAPQYHDFKVQYQALITLCDKAHDIRRSLITVLRAKSLKQPHGLLRLHPDVIKNVRHILI